jgi:hypothetical protein
MYKQIKNRLSSLPTELVSKIFDFSDYNAEVKKYFSTKVLPQIDETICFLNNENCPHCFIAESQLKLEKKTAFHARVCFSCMRVRKGTKMVSAHSESQQWRTLNKVLHLSGIEAWKQSIIFWNMAGTITSNGWDQEHPLNTVVKHPFSSFIKRSGYVVTKKVRAMSGI